MNAIRVLGALLLAAAMLTACSKHPPNAKEGVVPPGETRGGRAELAAPATDTPAKAGPTDVVASAERFSAHDLAAALIKPGVLDLSEYGFEAEAAPSCKEAGPSDDWTMWCQATYRDAERAGAPAEVDIVLFDHDAGFEALDGLVVEHVNGLKQEKTVSVKHTGKESGKNIVERTFPMMCHQALGRRNSAAWCVLQYTPRIFVLAATKPSEPHLPPSYTDAILDVDPDHSRNLAFFAMIPIKELVLNQS